MKTNPTPQEVARVAAYYRTYLHCRDAAQTAEKELERVAKAEFGFDGLFVTREVPEWLARHTNHSEPVVMPAPVPAHE